MGTGIHTNGGIVEFASSLYGTDDDPMDTAIMRDGVLHGLLHAADSMGQVRVNFMAPDAGVLGQSQSAYEQTETPSSTADWVIVGGSPFGPWPLTMRADATPYRLRFRIAGAVSATPATATFHVIIAPVSARLSTAQITEFEDWLAQATFTSTTPTWATGSAVQTRGDAASKTILTVSAGAAAGWVRSTSTYDGTSSTLPTAVDQVLVAAHVYAKTTDTAKLPQLYGLHISEYVGT